MNLLYLIIIFSALYSQDFFRLVIVAFFIGFLQDLFFGNLVGFTSLIFLLTCLLIYLYRRRFSSSHLVFQLMAVFLSDVVYSLLIGKDWILVQSLALLLASLIIFSVLNKILAKPSGLELEI